MRLNRRMTLEAPQRLADGAGGARQTWVTRGSLWVAVVPGTGAERPGQTGPMATVPCRIYVRGAAVGADSRPRPEERFREGGRVFRILAVAEADQDGAYLVCQALEEIVA